MIEQILECTQEAELGPFTDIERLAYTEVINRGARPLNRREELSERAVGAHARVFPESQQEIRGNN